MVADLGTGQLGRTGRRLQKQERSRGDRGEQKLEFYECGVAFRCWGGWSRRGGRNRKPSFSKGGQKVVRDAELPIIVLRAVFSPRRLVEPKSAGVNKTLVGCSPHNGRGEDATL